MIENILDLPTIEAEHKFVMLFVCALGAYVAKELSNATISMAFVLFYMFMFGAFAANAVFSGLGFLPLAGDTERVVVAAVLGMSFAFLLAVAALRIVQALR